MLKIARILLPIDFQDSSKRVVHQAATLARHFHSEIVMLHVVTPLSYSAAMIEGSYVPANLGDLLKELIRQAQKQLDRALGSELDGLAVKRVLLEGDPALTIVKTARDEKADLIAMPTHGYGAFRRFLLGSVTAKVLHDSDCPVWTGAHLEEEPTREFSIRNILCAVDLSPHSPKTIQWAAQMAAEFGARLTLAHITSGVEIYGPGAYQVDPSVTEALVNSAGRQLANLQQEVGIKAEVFIGSGDVPKMLSHSAKQSSADVLIIGRPAGGRLRATGYGIIRESRIPVLSV
ncbi:MAG: universal stress protein [Acidobacteriia bacterium]|nr:universal stress protein [Terriglobia bacterium]